MENLDTALLLMVVGMVTVFAILFIVIYIGKLLIAAVNKYAPEEAPAHKDGTPAPAPVPANIRAAIDAAVSVITHGKGRVARIEKVSH